jgi:hypothetical protein
VRRRDWENTRRIVWDKYCTKEDGWIDRWIDRQIDDGRSVKVILTQLSYRYDYHPSSELQASILGGEHEG